LSPLKRIAFSLNAEDFNDRRTTRKPSWLSYWISRVLITGSIVFYIYWVFAWGVKNGGKTLRAWGSVFVVSEIQDILLVIMTKILILVYLPALIMQPQLTNIRIVLTDNGIHYLNHHDISNWEAEREEVEELHVVRSFL
jgi:hypothetical protein